MWLWLRLCCRGSITEPLSSNGRLAPTPLLLFSGFISHSYALLWCVAHVPSSVGGMNASPEPRCSAERNITPRCSAKWKALGTTALKYLGNYIYHLLQKIRDLFSPTEHIYVFCMILIISIDRRILGACGEFYLLGCSAVQCSSIGRLIINPVACLLGTWP
jgi:hypothetical protein